MNDSLEHFLWLNPWLTGVLFVAVAFAIGYPELRKHGQTRITQGTLQVIILHAILVPYFVFYTLCCYRHPEWLQGDDGFLNAARDMRSSWPLLAIGDAVAIAIIIRQHWQVARLRQCRAFLDLANRLWAEGRQRESDAALREAARLYPFRLREQP